MTDQETDPAFPKVHQAIMAVMRAVDHVAKREGGSGLGYKFRGIDAVINAVGPKMREAGVFILPDVVTYDYQTVKTAAGKDMASVRLTVCFRFVGPAGDELASTVVGEAFDSGDKATAKAMSVALRTCLLQVLALPTDEPDPDTQQYDRGSEQERDLGRWTGEVAAAGLDRAKLKTLWDQMKAEWENVPWSEDRRAIIQPAVNASLEAAEQAARANISAATEPEPPTSDEQAAVEQARWLEDMDKAVEEKDLPTLRKMVTQAQKDRRSDRRRLLMAQIEELAAQ